MARRTGTFVVKAEGRDQGGIFFLEEMPVMQATDWFIRAMQFMVRAGADVPPNIFEAGAMGFATMGIGAALAALGKAPWAEVKPLLEELTACVKSYQAPGAVVAIPGWPVIVGQLNEPATILQLYEEVISVHLGFSIRDRLLACRKMLETMIAGLTPTTETSTEPAPLSSEADSPPSTN